MRTILTLLLAAISLLPLSAQKTYFVCAGVSNYDQLNDLSQTTRDAKRLAKLYKDKGAVIVLMTSKNAHRDNIIATIRKVAQKSTPKDHVVFSFSGHGAPGLMCTYDGDGHKFLTYSELFKELAKVKSAMTVAYIDACFSGSASENVVTNDGNNNWMQIVKNNKMVVYVSSRSDEVSYEYSSVGAGLMTNAMLKGLQGKADSDGNHQISVIELFKYLYADVQEHNPKQHPQLIAPKSMHDNVLMTW